MDVCIIHQYNQCSSKGYKRQHNNIALTSIQKGENRDINGDGFVDLVISAPTYNANQGRVYVFNGVQQALARQVRQVQVKYLLGRQEEILGHHLL